jgi:hypothetical protein
MRKGFAAISAWRHRRRRTARPTSSSRGSGLAMERAATLMAHIGRAMSDPPIVGLAPSFSDTWKRPARGLRATGPLFLVLVCFLGSFGFIRLSARLGRSPRVALWPLSVVSDGGAHLHHLVWRICLMLAGGTLGFAMIDTSPWRELCAGLSASTPD